MDRSQPTAARRIALTTDKTVAALKAEDERRIDFWDSGLPGFGVRVAPPRRDGRPGRKTFVLMYRSAAGKQRRLKLGVYPIVSLAEARKAAKVALGQVAQDNDPAAERAAKRAALSTPGSTVAELVAAFIEDRQCLRSVKEYERTLNRYVVPVWGDRPVCDITRRDVRDLIGTFKNRRLRSYSPDPGRTGAPVMAARTLAITRKMFNFAIEHEWLDDKARNPCVMVRAEKSKARDRALTHDEISALWHALDTDIPAFHSDGRQKRQYPAIRRLNAAFFRLLLLTAQRPGEVKGLVWEDIDLKAGIWTIPASKAKNGKSHRVPLSTQALAILHDLEPDDERRSGPVFASPKRGRNTKNAVERRPLANVQKAVERLRKRLGFEFRAHDLRRTAASQIAEAGYGATVPKILNHTNRTVTAIYDRYSYDREKRAALEAWGETLARIVAAPADADLPLAG